MTENQDNPLPRDRHRATACGGRKTTIAFVLYERFAILDLAAPVDVLQAWPNAEFVFVAESTELVRADSGLLVAPTASLSDLQAADLIVVPGTDDPRALTRKHALTEWTRRAAETATWISSVCTGALDR